MLVCSKCGLAKGAPSQQQSRTPSALTNKQETRVTQQFFTLGFFGLVFVAVCVCVACVRACVRACVCVCVCVCLFFCLFFVCFVFILIDLGRTANTAVNASICLSSVCL